MNKERKNNWNWEIRLIVFFFFFFFVFFFFGIVDGSEFSHPVAFAVSIKSGD